jgi:1-acyl-sn-glycerol-3-phosphate acyltransferase
MIIKANPIKLKYLLIVGRLLVWLFSWRFNKMKINEAEVLKDHSYILMCNHFSYWDGFWAGYLCLKSLYKQNPSIKGFYIMVLEKQMQQNKWLTRLGCFSIAPGTITVGESLDYAAALLDEPGNIFLMYPQGKLESNHVKNILIKPGIAEILKRVKGNCQLLWSTNLIEYFESLKPSVYFHVLNCGTNKDFNLEKLTANINQHHKAAIKKQFRFTVED